MASPAAILFKPFIASAAPAELAGLADSRGLDAAISQQQASTIERLVAGMSREQKMAQMLLVGFAGTEVSPFLRRWVAERGVGGVALFGRNLKRPGQIRALTSGIVALARGKVGPFVAVDQEGGSVLRIRSGLSVLPSNMALGATDDARLAYLAGRAVGSDLRALGFNMNFAPVLDINSNPKNPVINVRSFGERPARVAALGEAFLRGQQAAGISAVVKHYPGHGDTNADSHFALPEVRATLQRLNAVEFVPFRRAIAAEVDGIMTAHIALPLVAGAGRTPATLSPVLLDGLLRERLGYDGLVVTDDLEMQGIAQRYGLGNAVVRAIVAGADMPMVLWGEEGIVKAMAAIEAACADGALPEARLDRSVRRILRVKAARGLLHAVSIDEAEARVSQVGSGRLEEPTPTVQGRMAGPGEQLIHAELMDRIAEQAITLVSHDEQRWPWARLIEEPPLVVAPRGLFYETLEAALSTAPISLPDMPTEQERLAKVAELTRALKRAKRVVVAVANRYHVEMVRAALTSAPGVATVVASLASPYWRADFPDTVTYLCTYSTGPMAQLAAARVVLGQAPPQGHLPVTLDDEHRAGHGLGHRRHGRRAGR